MCDDNKELIILFRFFKINLQKKKILFIKYLILFRFWQIIVRHAFIV